MHPVLVSRTGRSSNASFAALAIGSGGGDGYHQGGSAGVTTLSADVAASEDAAFARRITTRDAAVVLHAAGALRDAMLSRQTTGNVRAVAAPKSSAAARWWGGGERSSSSDFACSPLDAAVAFGSIAALVGSVGQTPYAASNAALESFAAHDRARGGVGFACAWGAWRGAGMAAGGATQVAERFGLGSLTPSQGLAALAVILASSASAFLGSVQAGVGAPAGGSGGFTTAAVGYGGGRVIATPIDWPVLLRSLAARGAMMPAFDDLRAAAAEHTHAASSVSSTASTTSAAAATATAPLSTNTSRADIPAAYAGLHGEAAIDAVTVRLVTLITESTGAEVNVDDPLMESGLDSVAGVELQQRAEQEFNVRLEPTAALDHPTAASFGRHIADVMGLLHVLEDDGSSLAVGGGRAFAVDTAAAARAGGGGGGGAIPVTRGVAVYSDGVNDASQFWCAMSRTRGDPQAEVPLSRYDVELCYDPLTVREIGVVTVRHGAFLSADIAERFDADLLRVSPSEALHLDPQQRLLLEVCARSAAAAGLMGSSGVDGDSGVRAARTRERTGVYVGCMYNEAPLMQQMYGVEAGAHAGTGSGAAFMCGRVSYCLALNGPCVSTDTACSSSLVAAHLARRAVGKGASSLSHLMLCCLCLLYNLL
jgi:acyl carrier protein